MRQERMYSSPPPSTHNFSASLSFCFALSSPIDVVPLAGIYFTNTIHSLLFSHFLLFFSFMAFVLLHSEMMKQMLRAQRPEIVSVASLENFSTNFHTNFLLINVYEHART